MGRTLSRSLLLSLTLALVANAQQATPKKPTLDQYGPLASVDPNRTEPAGTHYKTFHSRTINADASYLIYLPPAYEQQTSMRYPVVYFLHGSGGTPVLAQRLVARRRLSQCS